MGVNQQVRYKILHGCGGGPDRPEVLFFTKLSFHDATETLDISETNVYSQGRTSDFLGLKFHCLGCWLTISSVMQNLIMKLKSLKDTLGQDLIEYALMAGFVAVAAGAIMPGIASSISTIFSKVASVMAIASTQG